MSSPADDEPGMAETGTTWSETGYFWIVLCKNRLHHFLRSIWVKHPILLGEADSVSPPPLIGDFLVKCDECGKEFRYHPRELMRFETEPRRPFVPHPLFRTADE